MTPAWILDIFAAVVLTVAVLSTGRIVAAWPWRRRAAVAGTDIAYVLTGIAMAGTLAASLRTLPGGAWQVIFAVLTAWLVYQAVQDARASGIRGLGGSQWVLSAAMLYLFLALVAPVTGGGAASGAEIPMLHLPTLAFVFAFVLAGYSVLDLDRLSGVRYSVVRAGAALADGTQAGGLGQVSVSVPGRDGPPDNSVGDASPDNGVGAVRGFLLSPGMTVGCRVATSVTMVFMLLIMI